jgi:hypothetical protein
VQNVRLALAEFFLVPSSNGCIENESKDRSGLHG